MDLFILGCGDLTEGDLAEVGDRTKFAAGDLSALDGDRMRKEVEREVILLGLEGVVVASSRAVLVTARELLKDRAVDM